VPCSLPTPSHAPARVSASLLADHDSYGFSTSDLLSDRRELTSTITGRS
jgi:hypothetical protein